MYWLVIASTFLFKNSFCQNLIQNGSFENISNVDCNGGFYNGTLPNAHVLDYWYQYNSPDYFSPMCGAGGYSVPNSWFGYSQAKNGSAFVGFIGYAGIGTEAKEYLYQQLPVPLVSGKTYLLNFYVSLADASNGAIKNIGAYFCPTLPSLTGFSYINVIPQIENQNGYITDTLNWQQIQGLYNALGGEQYVIFGNFNSNANTDTIKVNTNSSNTTSYPRYSYYYIDDITLVGQSSVGINELSNEGTVNVYPNPANDIVNFQFSDANTKRKIELYNTIGELFLKEDAPTQNSSLKTHHLQSGVYFYHILVGEKIIKTDKIVIIK
jgi:hypothetical protein